MGNRLTLREGRTSHESFEPLGFRYLIVTVRGSDRPLSLKVSLRSALYPLDVKARFESSDAGLNDIWRMSVRTQECCMLDSYVDCPWREQAQWWGDARVQAANTFHLAADERMLARGIRSVAGQTAENGLTYGMTPTIAHHCILPDYTLTWIMTIWDYYRQTGDKSLVVEQADRMTEALRYFEGMLDDNGLLPYDDRYWLFLDWADIFKAGYPTLYNIFYFWALNTASKLYGLAGRRKEAAASSAAAARVRRAIMSKLFDRRAAEFLGGLDWQGRAVRYDTAHAYALAIVSGLAPEYDARFLTERLLPLVREDVSTNPQRDAAVLNLGRVPSPFFMYYIFEALKRAGYGADVIDCIRRWWGMFLDWDVTTTPEVWQRPQGHSSACHAWSAHPIVHFCEVLLGVRQDALAWKRIVFSPVFVGERASGAVATPLGTVESSWQRSGETIDVTLIVPKRMTARVMLPGAKCTVGSGRHRWRVKP